MAIEVKETNLFRITKSDSGMYIRKIGTNEKYEEAWDKLPCHYEYEETNELIPPVEDPEMVEHEAQMSNN